MRAVALIGTLDTKGDEIAYVRERLVALRVDVVVIDSGILGEPHCAADISHEEVAAAAGYTLEQVRAAGVNVCCGGIVGMGETRADRVGFLHALATLPEHPGSVPINALVPIAGTPLGDLVRGQSGQMDEIEFVRTVAVARILMPASVVRLSAGRESMTEAGQALCFLAGANSIFYGDKLLTAENPGVDDDRTLLAELDLVPQPSRAVCAPEAVGA